MVRRLNPPSYFICPTGRPGLGRPGSRPRTTGCHHHPRCRGGRVRQGHRLLHQPLSCGALANNNIDDFIKVVFEPVFLDTVITQMNANEKVFKLILADDRMRVLFRDYIAQKVYDEIRGDPHDG